MSQNDWATIMPFGPVTLIFYWPKQIFSGQPKEGWPSFQALHYVIKFVSDSDRSVVFSSLTLVSSTNKTDCNNIIEILLKVALNTIHTPTFILLYENSWLMEGIQLHFKTLWLWVLSKHVNRWQVEMGSITVLYYK